MAMSSQSDRRVAVFDDGDFPATSIKTREELHEMELEIMQPLEDQPTSYSLDLDVDLKVSRTAPFLIQGLPCRVPSPLDELLLSRCHSQSPDPVDSCWWKPANLLDSWAAPPQPLISAECCDFRHMKKSSFLQRVQDDAVAPVTFDKHTVVASLNGEDGWSPDPTVQNSFSSQPSAHRVGEQQHNEHRQGHSRLDEETNGWKSAAGGRRFAEDNDGQTPTTAASIKSSPRSASTASPCTSMQSVRSNSSGAAKITSSTPPTKQQPILQSGWKIVENKNRANPQPQRVNKSRSFTKDASPIPESSSGPSASWNRTPPVKYGNGFVSPMIGPQAMPSGLGQSAGSYSSSTTKSSRRSTEGGRSPSVTSPYSPYDMEEKQRLFDNAMKDYDGFKYVDTHCHLDLMYNNMHKFDKYSAWRQRYRSTYPPTYEGCIPDWCDPSIYDEHADNWWQTVMEGDPTILGTAFGCHPHLARLYNDTVHQRILHLVKSFPKVVAVGECGFDFSHKNDENEEVQQNAFRRQVEIAKETDKVLLIHCRGSAEYASDGRGDAEDMCFNYVKQGVVKEHTVHRHCFTYGWRVAERWLKEFPNLFIGLTPLILNAAGDRAKVYEVVKNAPLDRLLIETDSPYFMPNFYKSFGVSKGGHPGGGINVALRIAEVRGMEVGKVLEQLRDNTRRCYRI